MKHLLDDAPEFENVLAAMTEEDQAVLVPYYVYGYSAREIGEVLGLQRRATHLRIERALRRTRRKLAV